MDIGLVCGACETFSAFGASACGACGQGIFLEAPLTLDRTSPPGVSAEKHAGPPPVAIAEVSPADNQSKAAGIPTEGPQATLVFIKNDGTDGDSFSVGPDGHAIGRQDGASTFPADPFMSPTQALFQFENASFVITDQNSYNGVYKKILTPTPIHIGDMFLLGQQLLMLTDLHLSAEFQAEPDGTYNAASPGGPYQFRVAQRLRGGGLGFAYCAKTPSLTFGREGNDVNFPTDPFISGNHAQVSVNDGTVYLADQGSRNGTFIRIREKTALENGDHVFMGQQLLRVELA